MNWLMAWAMLGLVAAAWGQPNMTGRLEHPCLLVSAETAPVVKANCNAFEPNDWGVSTGKLGQRLLTRADRFLEAPPYRYRVNFPATGETPLSTWEYELSAQTPPPHPERPDFAPWNGMFREAPDSISTRVTLLSFAYLVTGERKYAEAARSMVLSLVNWERWTDASYAGGRHQAGMDTGLATKSVAIFYDWCQQTLSDADRAAISQALIDKGIVPIIAELERCTPGTEVYAALVTGLVCGAIALRPEEPRAGQWLAQGIDALGQALDESGADGGVFAGPSLGSWLVDSCADALDALTVAEVRTDLFERPLLATLPEYCVSLLTPDGKVMPNFGDGVPVAGFPRTMAVLARRGSTAAAWYLKQTGTLPATTVYDLLRFDADRFRVEAPDFELSCPFADVGCAILRAGLEPHTPYLCFKSGPPERDVSANHFDHNSFQLSYLGEFLIADRGPHHRFLPARTKFTRGTIGHSSLVLDLTDEYLADTSSPDPGHDQVSRAGGRIEQFFTSPVLDYVQGQAAAAYNSNQLKVVDDFTRRIVYLKPWIYVMLDRVRMPAPHTCHLCLQAPEQAQVERLAEDRWKIVGRRSRLDCWFGASVPISTSAQRYPGAEAYGQFLTVNTAPQTGAGFLTLMYPRTHHGDSLLSNPGFEGSYRYWIIRSGEDEPNHVIDYQVKHSGQSSARIDGSGYYYSQRLPVSAGDRVRASVWMRTEGATKGGVLVLYWWAGPSIGSTAAPQRTAEGEWVKLEVEGVAPPGAREVCMACNFHDSGRVWFDDADIWLENPPEMLQLRRPEPKSVVLAEGARGGSFEVEDGRLAVALGGAPVDLGTCTLATDGTLACLGDMEQNRFAYLQEGTTLSYNGVSVLRTERPLTVCVWRDADGAVHVRAQERLVPHAPRLSPPEIRVTVRSDVRITQAMCEGAPLRVTANPDGTYTLGGQ